METSNFTSQFVEMTLNGFFVALIYTVLTAALLFVYKAVHDKITPYDDCDEMRKGNTAAAVSRGGAYLGVAIAAMGSLIGGASAESLGYALGMFVVNGVFALIVVTTAVVVFDRIIVWGEKNHKRISEGNLAVGILEGSSYIAIGVITSASFSGGGLAFWPGMLSALVFSATGILTLALIYLVYNLFWKKVQGCAIDRQVADGNVAAAIDAGTLLIAMSITLWFSISGDFTGWVNDFIWYGMAVATSTLVVPVARLLASRLLASGLEAPGRGQHHSNPTKSVVVGAVAIGAGFMLGVVQFM